MITTVYLLSNSLTSLLHKSYELWQKNIYEEITINESLATLNRNIGYGGFIHNLKNLIIRRDLPRYQHAIERNIIELTNQLEKIENQLSSKKDHIAIKQLRLTFNIYEQKYEIVKKMILANKATKEIDAVVKISDTSALAAIKALSASIKKRVSIVEQSLLQQKSDILRTIEIARVIIFSFIIILIYFLITYVKREHSIKIQLQHEKDNAEQASMAKSKFIDSMSHEFRTPLNAILGFSQLLVMDAKDKEMKENVQEIINAGNNLLELLNQVLDLSKIQSGTMSLSIESYNLNELLNTSLSTVKSIAAQNSIDIDNKVDPLHAYKINVDKTQFNQILLNLLSNAIKYNSENGKVIIDCLRTNDNKLRISISDTGKGLTPEQQSLIFKSFDRAGAQNSNIRGSGLGLVISKNLIEQMNGSIGVESEEGKGSRFWIQVPLT